MRYTREEAILAFKCLDCGRDTAQMSEYYMVHNRIWKRYGVKHGMLCIGCLERRMGRKLTKLDFTDAPTNRCKHSARLFNRLRRKP